LPRTQCRYSWSSKNGATTRLRSRWLCKRLRGIGGPVTYVPLTRASTSDILNLGGTILGSTNKGRFAARTGVADKIAIESHLLAGVEKTIDTLGLDGLICVGGDGSLSIAQQFYEYGLPVVGVPKTIDNDLSATAFTFGFDSAVSCATDALDRLHTTAASHERVIVLEVMGRHAGWIGLHAGIAGGADVILIPEIAWTFEGVCQKILERDRHGERSTLVVVAEGAELPCGNLVTKEQDQTAAQTRLGGIGAIVADEISQRLGKETRAVVLGHLQRGGGPTTFDRVLATQYGAHAFRLITEERFGEMVCYQPPNFGSVPIADTVNEFSRVDVNGSIVVGARGFGVSFGDEQPSAPFARKTKDWSVSPAVEENADEPSLCQ
jgi:6-phosphofructokinase